MVGLMLATAWALPSLDEPLRTGASAPHDAAVVIGVEGYAFVPEVPYARRDADLIHDVLVYTVGVPMERVHRLIDPSREQIEQALDRAVAEVEPGGTLWVSFAGHGAAAVADGSRLVLGVDVKADPAVFEARGVPVSRLAPSVEGVRTVALLDTCYAGVSRGGAELVAGARFAVPAYAETPSEGVVVWSAAGPNQLAGGADSMQHGAFSYLAAGALRGWADGELDGSPDGLVTLDEAQAFVARELRGGPREQQPSLVVGGDVAEVFGPAGEPGPGLDGLWDAPVVPAVPAVPAEQVPPARDGECPWSEPPEVSARLATVTVDGTPWYVAGRAERRRFEGLLRECRYPTAARLFRQWRATRRTTNFTMYPWLSGLGLAPMVAGMRRRSFEAAFEAGQ